MSNVDDVDTVEHVDGLLSISISMSDTILNIFGFAIALSQSTGRRPDIRRQRIPQQN